MLRTPLLWLSEQPRIFRFVRRNGLARRMASRFVAGETVETGVTAARDLAAATLTSTLDLLGESVSTAAEATAARDTYLQLLERLHTAKADVNVSVKLTQMGLDLDPEMCVANLGAILARAKALDGFVRLDMEGSAYTERTLALFRERLWLAYRPHVGIVLQSYLRRTAGDVEGAIGLGVRVRLCKGAYQEPPSVAFPAKADVDANYIRCAERLLVDGAYPGLATHDEAIIAHVKSFAQRRGIARDRFEFQMLYGVRRDLQLALRREGYRVRVYIPFGTHWYPYLMRRLAERPANVMFIVGNILKESVRRS